MTSATVFTQYSTVLPLIGTALPSWVPAADQVRIAAYQKYEEIYWTSEEGFQEVMRGDNENPVLMPTARTLVDTVNRYTATGFGYAVEPLAGGDTNAVVAAQLAFKNLFDRERFLSKFAGAKRKGIAVGDWCWHVYADPAKPLGKRLSLKSVDPGAYFPVYESDVVDGGDPDKIVKVHLAEQVAVGKDTLVSRLTYERIFDSSGVQTGIQTSHAIYKIDGWATAAAVKVRDIIPPTLLPAAIPAIPVYHIKNFDDNAPFGSSEMRGLESVLVAISQTVSDEDLTVSIEGLGVYTTSGGAPVDSSGNEVGWVMGPGRVLTHAGDLKRISGAGSVSPYGDHYDRMMGAVRAAVGASDAAVGKIDGATAESGIALLLQLGPMLAYSAEKDQTIRDVIGQMFYDLSFWLAEYEELPLLLTTDEQGASVPAVHVVPTFGDKVPTNAKAIIEQIVALRSLTPPVISLETVMVMLREAGLPLQANELDLVKAEQAATDAASLAAFGGVAPDTTAALDTATTTRTATELAAGNGVGADATVAA